jgi:ligand-binding sensor domain-containing protein
VPRLQSFLELFFVGALCWSSAVAAALETGASWLARSWQSDEGLPDNSITGVAQIGSSYLWLGTLGGPVSFDGARFRELPIVPLAGVPTPNNASGLAWIVALLSAFRPVKSTPSASPMAFPIS